MEVEKQRLFHFLFVYYQASFIKYWQKMSLTHSLCQVFVWKYKAPRLWVLGCATLNSWLHWQISQSIHLLEKHNVLLCRVQHIAFKHETIFGWSSKHDLSRCSAAGSVVNHIHVAEQHFYFILFFFSSPAWNPSRAWTKMVIVGNG